MAIDNENLEMVELLINSNVETKDALLHAISEEFVEAVEVLLDHEDSTHKAGEPHVSKRKNINITKASYRRTIEAFLSSLLGQLRCYLSTRVAANWFLPS